MFTGLIEEVGTVLSIAKSSKSAEITVKARHVMQGIGLGDSISTNGVCLTVISFDHSKFTVDVMAETMRRSNLGKLSSNSEVNLERALRVGDRLGGHLVSGHIDGTGILEGYEKEDNAVWATISASPAILKYIIRKGSVALDGVSLTVAYVDNAAFKVSIIPHTKDMTTILRKNIGDEINIECDMIGKYIEKFVRSEENETASKKVIDVDFLSKHGFL